MQGFSLRIAYRRCISTSSLFDEKEKKRRHEKKRAKRGEIILSFEIREGGRFPSSLFSFFFSHSQFFLSPTGNACEEMGVDIPLMSFQQEPHIWICPGTVVKFCSAGHLFPTIREHSTSLSAIWPFLNESFPQLTFFSTLVILQLRRPHLATLHYRMTQNSAC